MENNVDQNLNFFTKLMNGIGSATGKQAEKLDETKLKDVENIFAKADFNNDGATTLEEFMQASADTFDLNINDMTVGDYNKLIEDFEDEYADLAADFEINTEIPSNKTSKSPFGEAELEIQDKNGNVSGYINLRDDLVAGSEATVHTDGSYTIKFGKPNGVSETTKDEAPKDTEKETAETNENKYSKPDGKNPEYVISSGGQNISIDIPDELRDEIQTIIDTKTGEVTFQDKKGNEIKAEDINALVNVDKATKTETIKEVDKDVTMFKKDDRIKTDKDGNKYINVEKWSTENGNNGSLYGIIKNSYDLDAMGIKFDDEKFNALAKAVMDAKAVIYGSEDGKIQGNPQHPNLEQIRENKIIYENDKMILPEAYDIEELGLERPTIEKEVETDKNEGNPEAKVPTKNGTVIVDINDDFYNSNNINVNGSPDSDKISIDSFDKDNEVKPEEPEDVSGTEKPDGASGTEEPEDVSDTEKPDGAESTEEPEDVSGTEKPDGAEGTEEPEDTTVTEKPEDTTGAATSGNTAGKVDYIYTDPDGNEIKVNIRDGWIDMEENDDQLTFIYSDGSKRTVGISTSGKTEGQGTDAVKDPDKTDAADEVAMKQAIADAFNFDKEDVAVDGFNLQTRFIIDKPLYYTFNVPTELRDDSVLIGQGDYKTSRIDNFAAKYDSNGKLACIETYSENDPDELIGENTYTYNDDGTFSELHKDFSSGVVIETAYNADGTIKNHSQYSTQDDYEDGEPWLTRNYSYGVDAEGNPYQKMENNFGVSEITTRNADGTYTTEKQKPDAGESPKTFDDYKSEAVEINAMKYNTDEINKFEQKIQASNLSDNEKAEILAMFEKE